MLRRLNAPSDDERAPAPLRLPHDLGEARLVAQHGEEWVVPHEERERVEAALHGAGKQAERPLVVAGQRMALGHVE